MLRFIFALSIAIFHTNPNLLFNLAITRMAVPFFFVLSGFSISLVLTEKYVGRNRSFFLYFSNRLLRIYPLYWVILFAILFFSFVKYAFHVGTPDNAILHLMKNTRELPLFLVANFTLLPIGPLWMQTNKELGFLVGPQIWAIQLEILFYLIAPLFMRMRAMTRTVTMLGILVLIYYFRLPSRLQVPVFALFASHFVYFSLGMVGYIFHRHSFIFHKSVWGQLAYPLFVSHIFFIKIVKNVVPTQNTTVFTIIVVAITLLGSYVLWKYIDEPIERWRQSRIAK